MGFYDVEPPDPGTGTGRAEPMTIRCVDCGARFTGAPPQSFSRADAHHRATGHALTYKGTIQARWAREDDGYSDAEAHRPTRFVPHTRRPLPDDYEPDNDQLEEARR